MPRSGDAVARSFTLKKAHLLRRIEPEEVVDEAVLRIMHKAKRSNAAERQRLFSDGSLCMFAKHALARLGEKLATPTPTVNPEGVADPHAVAAIDSDITLDADRDAKLRGDRARLQVVLDMLAPPATPLQVRVLWKHLKDQTWREIGDSEGKSAEAVRLAFRRLWPRLLAAARRLTDA